MDARFDRAVLFARIQDRNAVIGIIGIGYVGLAIDAGCRMEEVTGHRF
jgi:UDP-N-acetyl-D-mannosaminuronate dehydrogenase